MSEDKIEFKKLHWDYVCELAERLSALEKTQNEIYISKQKNQIFHEMWKMIKSNEEKLKGLENLINDTNKRVGQNSDGCRKDMAKIKELEEKIEGNTTLWHESVMILEKQIKELEQKLISFATLKNVEVCHDNNERLEAVLRDLIFEIHYNHNLLFEKKVSEWRDKLGSSEASHTEDNNCIYHKKGICNLEKFRGQTCLGMNNCRAYNETPEANDYYKFVYCDMCYKPAVHRYQDKGYCDACYKDMIEDQKIFEGLLEKESPEAEEDITMNFLNSTKALIQKEKNELIAEFIEIVEKGHDWIIMMEKVRHMYARKMNYQRLFYSALTILDRILVKYKYGEARKK